MSDDIFPEQHQTSTGIAQARRRVNPDSLAVRLGPDLVRDMEALIVPGNIEMPSFAVRKELQERYNVDRRHIYDYFHSRGLRVVKEEKRHKSRLRTPPHCNNKAAALPNTRRRTSLGIARASRENTPIAVGCSKIDPVVDSQKQQQQDTENPLVAFRSYHTRVSLEEPESCAFHTVTKPTDELYSMTPDAGDILFRHRPHHCNFEVNGQTLAIQQECNATSLFPTSTNTVFFTHARPLSSTERQAIYQALSDSLGPACGIQECVGTYRRHMQDRSRLYYESAHPVDKPLMPADLNQTLTPETNDFRFWLSSGEILGSELIHPTRIKRDIKHDIQKMAMKQCEDRLSLECRAPIGSDQPFMQTLDDLLPTPPTDTSHVMESPVIRSGQFAVALPFYSLVPEVERELPGEDGRIVEDHFSNVLGFTSVTNQQNANIPLEAVEAESFQSVPMSLAPYANDHSNTLSNASRGISSTSRCHVRRKGRLDRTETRFATFNRCRSPLRERHGMQTRSTTSRGESRRRATASAGGGI